MLQIKNTMLQIIKITPLIYINAGREAIENEEFKVVENGTDAMQAFLSYADFMSTQYYKRVAINKAGRECGKQISLPFQLEAFLLYAGISVVKWKELKEDPLNLGDCSLIEMAITAQQTEGGLICEYQHKLVQLLQGRAEKIEHSGSVSIEPITGMEVK